jgi:hypothetical protein
LVTVVVVVAIVAPPLGKYLAAVYGFGPAPGDRFFVPVERALFRVLRVDADRGQPWTSYATSLLVFSAVSTVWLFALLRLQAVLPFNPTAVPSVPPALAFNTAVSFVTGTNWQAYAGESTMSHFSQMAGLVVAQFTAAAVGMSVALALVRGILHAPSSQVSGSQLPGNEGRPGESADDRRGRAGRPGRNGCDPGGPEDARHQRRRVLQRRIGSSVRESKRALQLSLNSCSSSRSRSRSRSCTAA